MRTDKLMVIRNLPIVCSFYCIMQRTHKNINSISLLILSAMWCGPEACNFERPHPNPYLPQGTTWRTPSWHKHSWHPTGHGEQCSFLSGLVHKHAGPTAILCLCVPCTLINDFSCLHFNKTWTVDSSCALYPQKSAYNWYTVFMIPYPYTIWTYQLCRCGRKNVVPMQCH